MQLLCLRSIERTPLSQNGKQNIIGRSIICISACASGGGGGGGRKYRTVLRTGGGRGFKTVMNSQISFLYKNIFFSVLLKYFVWKSIQNILSIHWKMIISYTVENLRNHWFKSSLAFLTPHPHLQLVFIPTPTRQRQENIYGYVWYSFSYALALSFHLTHNWQWKV